MLTWDPRTDTLAAKESTMTFSRPLAGIIGIATCLLAPRLAHAQTCATDADCGTGMVCYSLVTSACSGGSAAPATCLANGVCTGTDATTTSTCTSTTTLLCVYRWELPCNADSDCGDGFFCQPTETGVCSASSGSASSGGTSVESVDAGVVVVSPTVQLVDAGTTTTCTTTTSYPGSCQSKVTTCTVDSDCPSTWTCVASPTVATITVGAASVPALDAGAATATTSATKTCQASGGTGTAVDVGSTSTTKASSAVDAGTTSGNGTTTQSTPTAATSGTSTGTSTQSASTKGGGCSLVAGTAPGHGGLFAGSLLALFLLARSRQRRR